MNLSGSVFVKAAEQHAEDSGEADMAFGDLEIYLDAAMAVMTPEQRLHFLRSPRVVECLEMAVGGDQDEASPEALYAQVAALVPGAGNGVVEAAASIAAESELWLRQRVADLEAALEAARGRILAATPGADLSDLDRAINPHA